MIYHIYGLYNEDYPHTYIGYTKDLVKRLNKHKSDAKISNSKVYKFMREVQGEWKLEVLETHECTKKYSIERERYYKELMGDLNTDVPGRTTKEWREDNKERVSETHKIWLEDNPEYNKTWYKKNKDKVNENARGWYLDNKERHAELGKIWSKNNPEKVKAKQERCREKRKLNRYTCECGSNLRCSDRPRHERSKSHIAYETQNKNI